jgi:hypothetical protein
MEWVRTLVSFWARLSNTMAVWAARAQDWAWPLNIIAPMVVAVSGIIDGIFGAFFDFQYWVDATAYRLSELLSWSEIQSRLSSFLSQVSTLWSWFLQKVTYINTYINTWWEGAQYQVKQWIAAATMGLAELSRAWTNFWNITWPQLLANVNTLLSKWNDFVTSTLPTLVSFSWLATWWKGKVLEVQELINGAFTLRENLWKGWQELRDQVVEFFSDPLAWLYDKLDDFIERFW